MKRNTNDPENATPRLRLLPHPDAQTAPDEHPYPGVPRPDTLSPPQVAAHVHERVQRIVQPVRDVVDAYEIAEFAGGQFDTAAALRDIQTCLDKLVPVSPPLGQASVFEIVLEELTQAAEDPQAT